MSTQAATTEKGAAELLAAIAAGPVGRAALAEAEAARAAKRRAVLETMRAALAEADEAGMRAADQIPAARAQADSTRAAWAKAQRHLQGLEVAASRANDRADTARARAGRNLAETTAIDRTVHRLRVAWRESLALVAFREQHDANGFLVATFEADPTHRMRADRMKQLAEATEALRFADMAPAEIEARCAAAVAELEGTAPLQQRAETRCAPPFGV